MFVVRFSTFLHHFTRLPLERYPDLGFSTFCILSSSLLVLFFVTWTIVWFRFRRLIISIELLLQTGKGKGKWQQRKCHKPKLRDELARVQKELEDAKKVAAGLKEKGEEMVEVFQNPSATSGGAILSERKFVIRAFEERENNKDVKPAKLKEVGIGLKGLGLWDCPANLKGRADAITVVHRLCRVWTRAAQKFHLRTRDVKDAMAALWEHIDPTLRLVLQSDGELDAVLRWFNSELLTPQVITRYRAWATTFMPNPEESLVLFVDRVRWATEPLWSATEGEAFFVRTLVSRLPDAWKANHEQFVSRLIKLLKLEELDVREHENFTFDKVQALIEKDSEFLNQPKSQKPSEPGEPARRHWDDTMADSF